MLVIKVNVWPQGDWQDPQEVASLELTNLTGDTEVADYSVLLRPENRHVTVYGHRRVDGWLPLARAALRAADPGGGFYTSPDTQVPADVLAVLPLDPYVSRACQTARAILAAGIELDGLLAAGGLERQAWAEEFFRSCRVTEKWTGLRCQDPRHGGDAPTDVAASTWTVTTTVTAPTPDDAEHWAGTLRDLQLAEHGHHMRLDIVIAPVVPETPHAAFQRRQLERGVAMWNAGADEPANTAGGAMPDGPRFVGGRPAPMPTVDAAGRVWLRGKPWPPREEQPPAVRAAADEECDCGHYFTSHLSAGRMGAKCPCAPCCASVIPTMHSRRSAAAQRPGSPTTATRAPRAAPALPCSQERSAASRTPGMRWSRTTTRTTFRSPTGSASCWTAPNLVHPRRAATAGTRAWVRAGTATTARGRQGRGER